MQDQQLQDLADFIASSPTPFHATATLRERLIAAGFEALNEREDWQLKAGGRYLVSRNDSSIIAFQLGAEGDPARGQQRRRGVLLVRRPRHLQPAAPPQTPRPGAKKEGPAFPSLHLTEACS